MKSIEPNNNLSKLRTLIDKLDKNDVELYDELLSKIVRLITDESEKINKLKKADVKLKRYEDMYSGIMSLISTNTL